MKALRAGGFMIFLKVEFSVPKLLYGNNFNEVEEPNFGDICWKLKNALYIMGVEVKDIKKLANANISTIHYSKNIILTDHSTPYTYLKEFQKINVNQWFDTNQTDFRNEGHSIKYRSNDYEVTIYDKLKDLEQAKKSDKKAIEKDNCTQLSLFDTYEVKQPFEVLRIEVRIGSRKKLQQILKKYHLQGKERNFNDLFSKEVSREVLLSTIDDIERIYPKILTTECDTLQKFTIDLEINNPKLKYSQLLKLIGAKALIQEIGVREFRKITSRHGKTQWYRLNKEMQALKYGKSNDIFKTVREAVEAFETIKLDNYKDKM
ncbi:hypothetical protein COU74_03090 [Candidatus Peregrinibacteria bacterium CG10_big_fil_rev_8_21_14_0_10_36_19]|nr:MAG: hypothetical protein COU74_03090 [Candidatus Peregrinibacteria bacterium CG10_big_fil_rev_8_21_14_0_10_36_19]